MPRQHSTRHPGIRRLLIANRGEIAIRIMRAASELGIATVAIYSQEDRFSLHRTKADEAYVLGGDRGPIAAYMDIDQILRIAREARVDAVHPGYGFLAETPEFAELCAAAGLIFIGPAPQALRKLGDKVAARRLAEIAGVPVMPATTELPPDLEGCRRLADQLGYPLMLKASWGGGGRGMRIIENDAALAQMLPVARREARAACGSDAMYLEKLVRRARHIEVQILGDTHGTLVHLYERDCTVQRRNQKVIERAPAVFLTPDQRREICEAALRIARAASYYNAGTVEFLQDADCGAFYFIEVNPRIQVEHTVTECVTGIDLVRAQICVADGGRIGISASSSVPVQDEIRLLSHALQCRITTEDPKNQFIPDYGRLTAYRDPAGLGVRLDAGTAYPGALITRSYDSLLVKVTTWAATPQETIARMHRALGEFRIRGVTTNLHFLDQVITHPRFERGEYTTRFIDETPELFDAPVPRDRATRILSFLADTIVNGNPEIKNRPRPDRHATRAPRPPAEPRTKQAPMAGTRQLLKELGPERFAQWMLRERRVLITDTSMRDAHQSLLATRVRTFDMVTIASAYAALLPQLFSVECWGGATFDVAMRFLKEDPWERLMRLRERMPDLLLQMLLRSANAVGYRNYPDNVVRHFARQAAAAGIDLFRIFDSLNWVDNMRVAIDAVLDAGGLCEAAICYTGNLSDPHEKKYTLDYYARLARQLKRAGTHILGIKDMAGLCQPRAAADLVRTLKAETGLPVHFHTHDTSGIASASVFAAIDAEVDAVDAAMDAMSGLTSQPNLGSIVQALRHGPRDSTLEPEHVRAISQYWHQVRTVYAPFESDIRSGASEVYVHGMPGGQYTNLRQQARALGIDDNRWPDVARAYAEVNEIFGDIVKVTPTSKAVGDLALLMVRTGLARAAVLDPEIDIAFPESVVQLFNGDLGQPEGGLPASLQRKVLKGAAPRHTERPGKELPPLDLEEARLEASARTGHAVSEQQLASYLMYPGVFTDYAAHRHRFGDVSLLPTHAFLYGMQPGQELNVELERGKTLIVRYIAQSDPHEDGTRTVFFELNGQPRSIRAVDRGSDAPRQSPRKADPANRRHIGAPMPGLVATVRVSVGQKVLRGEVVATLEAMKIETTVCAEQAGVVAEVIARPMMQVDAKDLLVVLD